MHCRAMGKPLGKQAKQSNRTKSTVRVRVEHVFGAQTNDMGGTLVRSIGLCRTSMRIGPKTLTSESDSKLTHRFQAFAR